jgi:peptidoglycan/LPS O-acetylase OafA/YrhL
LSITILKWIRLASLVVGCTCIVLVMLIFPEKPWPRDLLWLSGVAALVFTLVVNHLLKRADRDGGGEKQGS